MSSNQPQNTAASRPATELPTREEFDRLTKQAESGTEEALDTVRQALEQQPALRRALGNIAGASRLALAGVLSGGNPAIEQAILLWAAELEVELAGRGPTALELLAAQRVVDCWLEVEIAVLATAPRAALGTPVRQITHVNGVHRRFENAVKCLLDVRRQRTGRRPAASTAASRSGYRKKPTAGKRATKTDIAASLARSMPVNRVSRFLSPDAEHLEAVN